MKHSRQENRKASALIITVLLISVIASVSFAVTGLTLAEFRKASTLQDSISAYYAAESGIEHGLMQYRLWRDAQISKEAYAAVHQSVAWDDSNTPTQDGGSTQLFRIDGAGANSTPQFARSDAEKGTAWYGLKMWYKSDRIGDVENGQPVVGANSQRIFRDSAFPISVKGADKAEIAWQPEGANTVPRPPSNFCYFLEVIMTAQVTNDFFRDVLPDNSCQQTANYTKTINFPAGTDLVRVKPWDMDSVKYSLVLKNGDTPINFDNGVTYIESTGQVGKAKRKLRVGISRSTGTILESQDFLLLSGEEPIIINQNP